MVTESTFTPEASHSSSREHLNGYIGPDAGRFIIRLTILRVKTQTNRQAVRKSVDLMEQEQNSWGKSVLRTKHTCEYFNEWPKKKKRGQNMMETNNFIIKDKNVPLAT